MLTDNGKEYKGSLGEHPYELLLSLYDIENRFTRVGTPRVNGFMERFHGMVLDEFFREAFRKKHYASVDELETDLDTWLHTTTTNGRTGAFATWVENHARPSARVGRKWTR